MATLDPTLLDILVCPESRQKLAQADAGLVEKLNASIKAGTATNLGGERVSEPVEAALVRADGKLAYPIRSGIPELLAGSAIAVGR